MANYGAEFQRAEEYEKRLYNQIRDFLCKEWLEKKTADSRNVAKIGNLHNMARGYKNSFPWS